MQQQLSVADQPAEECGEACRNAEERTERLELTPEGCRGFFFSDHRLHRTRLLSLPYRSRNCPPGLTFHPDFGNLHFNFENPSEREKGKRNYSTVPEKLLNRKGAKDLKIQR